MVAALVCLTCKRTISNLRAARFPCPNCGKYEMIRCAECRLNAVPYVCPACEFKGPN